MEISARGNATETLHESLHDEMLPRRPDNRHVQEMIAKSKSKYRERLAKAVPGSRRSWLRRSRGMGHAKS
jgi:hypothetical protein